jgi:glycosyltransferase involved in cell wall biosynthesis
MPLPVETYSIVIPARNEAGGLQKLLPELSSCLSHGTEIIVVNDGSTDETEKVCLAHGARVLTHPYSKGNGASIKTGARAARGSVIVFMDADGQHQPSDISRLLDKLQDGYDMVVGARQSGSHAGAHRAAANDVFSKLATWMVQQNVEDLTSGFRAVRAKHFRQFLYLLPNGFSYPTTITMSFFRAGHGVAYIPIHAPKRIAGKSHINPLMDGMRFLLIIFKIGTLYSPLKLFLPMSLTFFFTALGYYLFTYFTQHRFSNMSVLLFTTSVLIFLIGLISEQITMLIYKDSDPK